jgi:Flp pilus assembly pilin Flp
MRNLRRDERGQGLVEYALILALVSLAAIVALGFMSGKINSLFSKTGNSLNSVNIGAGGAPSGPPPPPNGSVIGSGPLGQNLYYLGPGLANGSGSAPDGVEGVYALVTISSPTSFNVNGWTFTCAWHLGLWTYDLNGNGSISLSETFFSMCNAPAVPANTGLPVISGTPQVGQTLTTSNGTWSNNPSDFDYQWQYTQNNFASCAGLPSNTSWNDSSTAGNDNSWGSLPNNSALIGNCVRVQVRASNASGSYSGGESAWVNSGAVGPVVP